jgi:hypothetical protein
MSKANKDKIQCVPDYGSPWQYKFAASQGPKKDVRTKDEGAVPMMKTGAAVLFLGCLAAFALTSLVVKSYRKRQSRGVEIRHTYSALGEESTFLTPANAPLSTVGDFDELLE